MKQIKEKLPKTFKIIEETEDTLIFKVRQINYLIYKEDKETYQCTIDSIDNINISEEYYNNFIEYDWEEFIYAIEDKYYDWIKDLYKAIERMKDKYEEEFDIMVKYLI